MSLKVYLNYEGEPPRPENEKIQDIASNRYDREGMKLKTSLPAKWATEPCEKVLNLFLTQYNKKFPEQSLEAKDMYLRIGGITIPLHDQISHHIREYADIFVEHRKKEFIIELQPGTFSCTNFGCGRRYTEEDNHAEACHHHSSGPVFCDTVKYWSCCPDHKELEFDAFQKINPCSIGRHDSTPKELFKKKIDDTISNTPLTAEQLQAHGTSADYQVGGRVTGPKPFEGAIQNIPQQIIDGKARCKNFGCTQMFVVDENHEQACCHHSGAPVFWDTAKYWSCCPDVKRYDFDDFAKVPGCSVGSHKL